MNVKEAHTIIGNSPTYALKNMVKALSMLRVLNTEEEERRLEAGKIILKQRRVKL